MPAKSDDGDFPCALTIYTPFPTHRLANAAIRTLSVDQELSPLVRRSFSLVSHATDSDTAALVQKDPLKASLLVNAAPTQSIHASSTASSVPSTISNTEENNSILKTEYRATTNRMLRVAVNGFFENLNVVIQVMEELDVDVLHEKGLEELEGVQGVEQGMTGGTGALA